MNDHEKFKLINQEAKKLEKTVKQIWKDLTEIRDLARTDMPPEAYNLTQDEWNKERLITIAMRLSLIIGKGYYE